MNLTRFDPLRELEDLSSRFNRLLGPTSFLRKAGGDGEAFADWAPAVDVQETEDEYVIKADLPSLKKEDLKVSVDNGVLALEGERKLEKEEKGGKFHRIERSYGKFVRRLAVPTDVDQQRVAAEFKDGVLSVHLPKSPTAKPRSVEVQIS